MFLPNNPKLQKVPGPSASKGTRSLFVLRNLVPFGDARGFTLIEVLVSTVILASALVVIVQSLGRTQEALRISQNLVFASELGNSKLSVIEMEQREKIRLSVQHDQGKESFRGKVFQWESDVVPYEDPNILDQTRLNQAGVTVHWTDGVARQNKLEFKTLLLIQDKKKYDTVSSPQAVTP